MFILGFLTVIFIFLLIFGLMLWFKRKQKDKPIKGNGYSLLSPIPIFFVLFGFVIFQLSITAGPEFKVPAFWEIIIALLLGLVFGFIMYTQTSYEKRDDGGIFPKPNKNFKYVIIGIIVIRLGLTQYFKDLDPNEVLILAYSLAFTYISVWRIGSFMKFRKLKYS